jgi:hypothetical protein
MQLQIPVVQIDSGDEPLKILKLHCSEVKIMEYS